MAAIAAPSCVFMTGGTRHNLPGVACIVARLRALGTPHAVVVAAPAEDIEQVRDRLRGHNVSGFLAWSQVPYRYRGSNWAGSHVLDKLNVLASPYSRVVWLDPDMLVEKSIDSLCEQPHNVSLSAALNAGVEAYTCWAPPDAAETSQRGRPVFNERSWRCGDCAHAPIDGASGSASGSESVVGGALPPCKYMLNSGVMSLRPLPTATAFQRLVLERIARGEVASREGSDQGAINSLNYAFRLFGSSGVRILPSTFNSLARVYAIRGRSRWGEPRVIHFSGETKPWRKVGVSGGPREQQARSLRRRIQPLLDRWEDTCGRFRNLPA